MELVEGKTLHAALVNGPLPTQQAIAIGIQIAEALTEAHRVGILHRDIKSANIVLTPRGQVKVLDFGLAKRLGSVASSGDATPELTREGTTLGTLSPDGFPLKGARPSPSPTRSCMRSLATSAARICRRG